MHLRPHQRSVGKNERLNLILLAEVIVDLRKLQIHLQIPLKPKVESLLAALALRFMSTDIAQSFEVLQVKCVVGGDWLILHRCNRCSRQAASELEASQDSHIPRKGGAAPHNRILAAKANLRGHMGADAV